MPEERFRRDVLPHLDAGYNLARWLTGEPADADDVMQEAMLNAHRSAGASDPAAARGWFLQVVRNAAFGLLRRRRGWVELPEEEAADEPDPAEKLQTAVEVADLRAAIAGLKEQFREVVV